VVEEKMCCCVSGVFESGHGFDPLGNVIDNHDNVLVSITRWRMESREFYVPLQKGSIVMTRCRRVGGARALFP
jgi:hypothetical protein